MIRHEILVANKNVVYWELNPRAVRTMILLHGFRGSHEGLLDLSLHLPEYRLILPDRPGYGDSEPLVNTHSLMDYAAWLDQFVEALRLDEYVVSGHSYGGSIALIHSVQGSYKPEALIAVSPAVIRTGPLRFFTTGYYRVGSLMSETLRYRWLTSRAVEKITDIVLLRTINAYQRKAIRGIRKRERERLRAAVITEEYASSLVVDLKSYASSIEIPTLVIAGAKDPIVPLGELKKLVGQIPHCRLRVMWDQGHMAPLAQAARTADIIKAFLNDLGLAPNDRQVDL